MKISCPLTITRRKPFKAGLPIGLWLNRQNYDVAWAADQRSRSERAQISRAAIVIIAWRRRHPVARRSHRWGSADSHLGVYLRSSGLSHCRESEDVDILSVVTDALAGEMHVSRRAMLRARVYSIFEDGSEAVLEHFGLNDGAYRGPFFRYGEFDMTVSGHHIDELNGDGVVVSATGSAGYAFTGGPIVNPDFPRFNLRSHRAPYHTGARVH